MFIIFLRLCVCYLHSILGRVFPYRVLCWRFISFNFSVFHMLLSLFGVGVAVVTAAAAAAAAAAVAVAVAVAAGCFFYLVFVVSPLFSVGSSVCLVCSACLVCLLVVFVCLMFFLLFVVCCCGWLFCWLLECC